MSAGEIIAVLDAGPLIHLDELGSLRLLAGYREVLLPDIVEREAREHRPEIQINSIAGLVRVNSNPSTAESMFELAAEFGLHAGELAAIAVLKEHHGDCLLSDDAAARTLAEAIGFQVRGTVGLILRAWQRKQISKTAARDLLKALPMRSTLYLRPGFLASVLEQINDKTN
jgi:Predicted nucleic acid-binding protein, contains PIN domain